MNAKRFTMITLAALMAVSITGAAWANKTQDTYVGKLEFQDQTITKATAKALHRQILLQRATQLVGWAMPMMNFYQLYPALLSNMKVSEDEIFFGLYDGYDGVYPFMTANVTTPYTLARSRRTTSASSSGSTRSSRRSRSASSNPRPAA